ncbi:MAG: polysaccharide pyruvyl transferase family protein [Bryobacterales bacterium]|nr:polysaccharide pyruvyl transferase family protein [Bryobacterales bacterium]
MLSRRHFLPTFASLASPRLVRARKTPHIVLRSSWQTVNIGDIGHTPGVLALLERHVPEAKVSLWPMDIGNGVEAMLRRRFPKVAILKTRQEAHACDFLLHGSGPYLTAHRDVAEWRKETGKPYGVYGITMAAAGDPGLLRMSNNGLDGYCRDLLDTARFVFLRDGVSLDVVRKHGVKSPVIEFCPDGAFAADVRDDQTALAFLSQHGLEKGRFICCLPRLRGTPYWRVKPGYAFDGARHRHNEEMKEHDHAPVRDGIVSIVRETGMKVLVCPEDATQMETGKEMLVDPLPASVKPHVVWREKYWLTSEALSVYVRSAGLLSMEMHSPIMALGNGIPAIVCRFAEQTTKGFMWRDIGLNGWLFDLDKEEESRRVAPAALVMARNPREARKKAAQALEFVHKRQGETMAVVKQEAMAAV